MSDEATPPEGSSADEARQALQDTDPVAYYRNVAELARTGHGSLLQPLDYDPDLPFHAPTCVVCEPRSENREVLQLFARAAYRDFDRVLMSAFADPGVAHLLNDVFHRLTVDDINVALITNHGQIIDIALVLGALVLAMTDPERSFGVLGRHCDLEELVPRMNVLVSRMVATRQAFGMPTIEVLQRLCRVFLSVPQTTSRRRSRLTPELVRANNVVMRHALDHQLHRGGQLLAMAASGSQDLSLASNLVRQVRHQWRLRRGEEPGPAPSLHLQPLYRGTVTLMLQARYVLPVAISLDPAHPAVVLGALTHVQTEDDCHRTMDWIAEAHEEATGVNTVYHRHEDDLLTQVRNLIASRR